MDEIAAGGRSGGAASLAPCNDLGKVGHPESPAAAAGNPLECPTGPAPVERIWTQDAIDDDLGEPFICPVTQQPCLTEQDEFCEDYGCARKAGFDVDGSIP